jgi:hypothetical protein
MEPLPSKRRDARILPGQRAWRQFGRGERRNGGGKAEPQRLFRGGHEGALRPASDADGMNTQSRDERP